MISEHKFISSFTSIWREVTPLGDNYWRQQNLLLIRKHPRVENLVPANMRGLVNELAFMAFCQVQDEFAEARLKGKAGIGTSVIEALENCLPTAINYMNKLAFSRDFLINDVDRDCITEAKLLTENLLRFFPSNKHYQLRPRFNGCGILSACEGDLISDGCLYEVKAGDRSFRISDVRQLLVYAALAYANRELIFDRIALCNPRTGLIWMKSLDSICHSISGQRTSDVLAKLVFHFESTETTQ